jgi:hypothetical protein
MGGRGLPHRSRVTLKAGSVIKLKDEIDEQTAAKLQSEGLGPLRAEGFGFVQVSPALCKVKLLDTKRPPKGDHVKMMETSPAKVDADFITFLEDIAIRQKIRDRAEQKSADPKWREYTFGLNASDSNPTNAQLGALRGFMGRLDSEDELKAAKAYASAREEKDGSKKRSFKQTLIDRLEKPSLVLNDLEIDPAGVTGTRKVADLHRFALLSAFNAAVRQHKRAGGQRGAAK